MVEGHLGLPQWPVNLSPPSEGIGLAKLKMEGLRSGRGGGGAYRVSAIGIQGIIDVETDVLQVLRIGYVVLLCGRAARHARSARSTCALLA